MSRILTPGRLRLHRAPAPSRRARQIGDPRWISPIVALLAQDGITNGAVYALLALALVLVFAVTRVIWVPSGEFVAYGTLTLAGLQLGKPPGTVGLLVGMARRRGRDGSLRVLRRGESRRMPRQLALWLGIPLAIAGIVCVARRRRTCRSGRRSC